MSIPASVARIPARQKPDVNKSLIRQILAIALACLGFFILIEQATAQSAPEQQAQKQVTAFLEAAYKAGGDLGALSDVVNRSFAVGTWTNALLGKEGKAFSGAETAEFKRLFPAYIAKQYFTQFGGAGSKPGEVTNVRTVRGDVLVTSRIPGSGRTFSVDWRMRVIGGKPRVIDYTTGGISAVVLRRSEFQAKVQQSGPQGLNSFLKGFIGS